MGKKKTQKEINTNIIVIQSEAKDLGITNVNGYEILRFALNDNLIENYPFSIAISATR